MAFVPTWIPLFAIDETNALASTPLALSASLSNQTVGASNHPDAFVALGSATYTLSQTTTLPAGLAFSLFAEGGPVTATIAGSDKINGGATGAGATVPMGYIARFQTDGAGNWWMTTQQSTVAIGTIASASTTDICSVGTAAVSITGTTTITSFGSSCVAGQIIHATAAGAFQLTYNATSMILNSGGTNYTTAAGDRLIIVALGSGNYQVNVVKISGQPLSAPSNSLPITTVSGINTITAIYSPTVSEVNQLQVAFVSVGNNTSTAPTFNPNGSGAVTITKCGGQALVANDIGAANAVEIVTYMSGPNHWELQNPAFGCGPSPDPFFSLVTALFNFNNSLSDASGSGITLTNSGSVGFNNSVSNVPNGYSWGPLNGTSNYAYNTTATAVEFAAGQDFEIDAEVYPTANGGSGDAQIVTCYSSSATTCPMLGFASSNTTPIFASLGSAPLITSSGGNISLNHWHDLRAVRHNNTIALWVDCVNVGSTSYSSAFMTTAGIAIGGGPASNVFFAGYIQNVRVTQYARTVFSCVSPTNFYSTVGPLTMNDPSDDKLNRILLAIELH
ncbi:MAG TPA: LamG-like jellyroll fold domain-containing protein [Magnetospirillaceae bacterium]